MRKQTSYELADISNFKEALLNWTQQFDEVLWMDSNSHNAAYSSFEGLLACDGFTAKVTDAHNAFEELKEYQLQTNDWLFGYLSYDLKNDVENLSSKNVDRLHFPELYFFQPKRIIEIKHNTVNFNYLNVVADEIATDFQSIIALLQPSKKTKIHENDVKIKMRIFKDEYYKQVDQMLAHIHRGDIYEANFCQEFYAEDVEINALSAYEKLNKISKAPFASFMKLGRRYMLSASPERYLKKLNHKVISQPIKGTAKRAQNPEVDMQLIKKLSGDAKERAENIMIVDLVRNDLSKIALKGSVVVEELCKVYTFAQVHQMISTVVAKVAPDKNAVDIIKETFPMGSMTGAPKISAMKIIERLESFRRGLYSGAVGYFSPNGDFDFNVVIRSILYNEAEKYVSFAVGGAITAKSIPENEYEECLLKAKAMREVLESY